MPSELDERAGLAAQSSGAAIPDQIVQKEASALLSFHLASKGESLETRDAHTFHHSGREGDVDRPRPLSPLTPVNRRSRPLWPFPSEARTRSLGR